MLVLGHCAQAQDTVRLTLDSCLRYAYQHNVNVRTAELNREAAQVALTGAKLNFLPSVSASASSGWAWGEQDTRSNNCGVNASLTLFNGLSNLRNYQQAQLTAEQRELMVEQKQNEICSQIISAYLTILMNEEKLTFQQEVLETSHQQQLEGEVKYEVGRLLESDYQLLEANYLSALSDIENTRLTIANNQLALRTLLFWEEPVVLTAMRGGDSLSAEEQQLEHFDSVLAQARRAMPDWQISEMNVDIAKYNVDMAKAAYIPSLSVNAGASYSDGKVLSDDPVTNMGGGLGSSLTLGLSIPILNRGNSYVQYKQSKINLREAELTNYNTQLLLTQEIESQYLNTRQSLNRFRTTEAMVKAYHASYEVYVLKYAAGAITTVEMLQQQDKYLSALNEYLQNKYSYILDSKLLDNYTGKEIKL